MRKVETKEVTFEVTPIDPETNRCLPPDPNLSYTEVREIRDRGKAEDKKK